jgi:amino acid transporter
MMVYVTRWTLSMASHGAFASVFGRVSPRYMTPFWGTLILGGIMIAARMLMTLVNENLVYDIVPSLALLSAIEYAFTVFACVVYFRHWLTRSLRCFVLMGLLPMLGGTILLAVYVKSAVNYWNPANSYSGGWLGVGSTFWMGVGSTLLGAVLVLIARIHKPQFFKRESEVWPGEGQPIPYQDETVL